MKNLKYLFLTLLGALAFVACSDDAREADWSGIQGNGTYFGVDAQTSFMLEENQSSVKIPVMRSFTEGALATMVQLTFPEEATYGNIFVADQNARFADGEAEGSVEIVFDFDDIEAGVAYEMTLTLLDDTHMTGYGERSYTFSLKYDPWKTVGTALWRDEIIEIFERAGGSACLKGCEVECELQQSLADENLYRLVNPYTAEFFGEIVGAAPAAVAGNVSGGYITFNVADPDHVYVLPSDIGVYIPGLGDFSIASCVFECGFVETVEEGSYGQLVNNVIKFPANSLLVALPDLGSWYYTNPTGLCRIVLPGGVAIEPTVAVEYEGVMIDPDSNASAVFNLEMNADAGVVYFAAVDAASDLNAALAGMMDGTVECEAIYESGEFTYGIYEPGQYVGIFLPATKDGSVVGTPVGVEFEYSAGGVAPSEFTAEFTLGVGETDLTVAVTPNAKNLDYYWDFLPKENYDAIVAQFGSIEAYMQANFEAIAAQYGISVADLLAAYASRGPIEEVYYEELPSSTEFVAFAYCINVKTGEARSAVTEVPFTTETPAELVADYAAWLGVWNVQPTSMEDGSDAEPFQIEVSLKQSNGLFYVKGWGYGQMLPTYPVTMVWQQYEDGSTIAYIPEQLTNYEIYDGSAYATVAFMGRFYYEAAAAYYCYGGGGIPLVGGITGEGAATLRPYTFEDDKLGNMTFSGADYFLLYDDGIGAEIDTFTVGPYTLTKAAAEATKMSVSVDEIKTFKMLQKGQTKEMRAERVRALHMAKHNCVMIR